MFSCEFCKISKNTFSLRTPLVAASDSGKNIDFVVKKRKTSVSCTTVQRRFKRIGFSALHLGQIPYQQGIGVPIDCFINENARETFSNNSIFVHDVFFFQHRFSLRANQKWLLPKTNHSDVLQTIIDINMNPEFVSIGVSRSPVNI